MAGNIKKNSIGSGVAIVTIAFVYFIICLYLILVFHSPSLMDKIKEQVNIIVEFEEEPNDLYLNDLKQTLAQFDGVLTDKMQFINRDRALSMMMPELNENLMGMMDNPFQAMLVFQIEGKHYTLDNLRKIENEMKGQEMVAGFYFQKEIVNQLSSNLSKANWIVLIVVMIFILFMILVMISTVRLKLENSRFHIKTMELVGAKSSFINAIYRKDVFGLGMSATLMSILMLVILFALFYLKIPLVLSFLEIKWLLLSVVLTAGIGMIILWVTTKLEIDKYLSKHFYELYQ